MKLAFAFFLLMLSCALPAQAKPQIEANIPAKLDEAWKKNRMNGVNAELRRIVIDTKEERQTVLQWAEKRYSNPVIRDARLGLLLADTVHDTVQGFSSAESKIDANKTRARGAAVYVSSQVIAFEEVARCADKTAGKSYISYWLNSRSRASYKDFLARQPEAARTEIWAAAKKMADERNISRVEKDICAMGVDAIGKMQLDPACKRKECKPVDYVEMLDDPAWQSMRGQVQAMVRKRVLEGNI